MKTLEISDDSGFIGIADFNKYKSFISGKWDFEMMKEKIIEETNLHHLLFWGTGLENHWIIRIDNKSSKKEAFKEARGVIEVSNKKLYLVNYETLTMAAQFEKVNLPEAHLAHLFVELENGKYMVTFRQMYNPEKFNFNKKEIHFEIVIKKIENHLDLYKNNVNGIYWSNY